MDGLQLRKKRDRELIELLNELRVVLPGVQVLFAFLLIAPFNTGWRGVTELQRVAYLVALASTVLGSAFLIAPTAYHRLRWRERNKEAMLRVSNRLAIAGLGCVALAMTASVFLVVEEIASSAVATLLAAASGVVFGTGWFLLPLTRPYDRWDEDPPGDESDERSTPVD